MITHLDPELSVARGIVGVCPPFYTRPRWNYCGATPDESSRRALEVLMATVFKDEFVDKIEARGEARGEAAGRAQMILQVLAARRIAVPAEIRDQILACTDMAQLDAWGSKAATAQSVEEIFGTPRGVRD
jgi:hypothetical protein